MHFTEDEIRAIVRHEIRTMLGANQPQDQDIQYLPTEEAFKKLGYSSPAQLREAIANETFRLGKEVQDRRSKGAVYGRYYFNIAACIKRLNTAPEKRAN
jgi:hypothetical protein